jgi:pimeloyl-ACP methyl ester carboxylesterase
MREGIRGSKLVVVPEAGHLLGLENPGVFNEAVRQYLVGLG